MTHVLFAYGTLKDRRIQLELFGKTVPSQSAWINGWGLYVGRDGYLFVKPRIGETLKGLVLRLTDSELAMADLWEDTEVYARETCRAFLDDGSALTSWLYTRRNGCGERFVSDACHAGNHADIVTEIRKIKAGIKTAPG